MKKYNLLNLNFKMVLHFGHSYFFEVFVLRNHFNEILFLQIGHFLVFIEQYFLPNQKNTGDGSMIRTYIFLIIPKFIPVNLLICLTDISFSLNALIYLSRFFMSNA